MVLKTDQKGLLVKMYNTLRGFLNGNEPDEPIFFAYSAKLRIFGDNLNFDEITHNIGIMPTYFHRKGEKKGPRSPGFPHDMWGYSPAIAEEQPLEININALWEEIRPARDYLLSLKKIASVDVFLGYQSNCDCAGLEIPHTCMEMFTSLEIPFGLSIIVA